MSARNPVYTLPFGLLALSSFLFFASFNMIIPELPAYLTSLGGAEYKGLIIGLFTVTAGLSRPFSGKLADTVGRVPVMAFGSIVCFVCGFGYPLVGSVAAFLVLRLVHGFSTGFKPTGTSAYVADIVPATHRGEAMGVLGLLSSTGMAIGPAIGSLVADAWSLNMMFYCSSGFAILSILILMGMQETLTEKVPFQWKLLRISRKEIFEPRVIAPSIVLLLTSFGFGVILTVVPDKSTWLGMTNKGLFFTCFTLASLAIRFIAGKISDRHGRVGVMKVSCALLVIALAFVGMANSTATFLGASILYGIANGMNSPTVSAWTIDLSHEAHRGRAMATMYIALEAGIGLGAVISGWIYANNPANFPLTFFVASGLCLVAFIYLWLGHKPAVAQAS